MTRRELTARKKIIGAINKIVPALISESLEARQEARVVLSSLRDAEMLLSLASLPARSAAVAELAREQEQTPPKDQGEQ